MPGVYLWWINDKDREIKEKIYLLLTYKVVGRVRIADFAKAVTYAINRHESLRSTFRLRDNRYWMYVSNADAPEFEPAFFDVTESSDPESSAKELFYFKGHTFNLETGPLFLVRLIKVSDDTFFISFKMHHIIYDTLSIQVMQRDLASAYLAFAEGTTPILRKLKFQYKDFMSFTQRRVEMHAASDRAYWNSLYSSLPEPLFIPGRKQVAPGTSLDKCCVEMFTFPDFVFRHFLPHRAQQHSTNFFVILQATFKWYLFCTTGQNDMLAATMVFGRDLEGSDDQIGLYARVFILRTVLSAFDSFDDCVRKVKKANEDSYTRSAFPLIDLLFEMIAEKGVSDDTLWRVALNYDDFNSVEPNPDDEDRQEHDIEITQMDLPEKSVATNIDLYLNFVKYKDSIGLKVTYKDVLFESQSIRNLIQGYFNIFQTV